MIGVFVTALFALGMAVLGLSACAEPRCASRLYGMPADDPVATTWVRAAGLRDLGLSLALAILLLVGDLPAAAVVSVATALIAVTDALNVVWSRGLWPIWPLGTHLSGIVVGLVGGLLLWLGI